MPSPHVEPAVVKELFAEALERPGAERAQFLDRACEGRPALRAEVESLLAAAVGTEALLGGPTAGAAPAAGQPGTRIGRYKLLQRIGEGGMGVVFMAEQHEPVRRRVALKVIKAGMDTRQVVARFEAERQALALMDHPNIAKVLDGGATEAGRPYFVMELVQGVPITEYCDRHHLTPAERLALFLPVCRAVQHAHTKGVIHRDIKPSNVLVTLGDGVPVPKVIDFGIAKATGQALTDKTLFTAFAQMVGTPLYMSPEQAGGGADVDTRSDVYSLGVLLYELLTGSTPFDRQRLGKAALDEVRRIIRDEEPPKPSTRIGSLTAAALTATSADRKTDPRRLGGVVRGELDWIVMRALEKDRGRRYESASALAGDVGRYLADEPVQACPPSAAYRLRKFTRKYRVPLATSATFALLLVAGTAVSVAQALRARSAERVTAVQRDAASLDRDRAKRAEAEAAGQRRVAEVRLSDSLISQGDALATAGEHLNAYARFAEAEQLRSRLGEPLGRLDLSLLRLYYLSPPPLWTTRVAGSARLSCAIPSDAVLITGGDDGTFHVHDLVTGAMVRRFGSSQGTQRLAAAAARGAEGPVLVAAGAEFAAVLDLGTGRTLREARDARAARVLELSPDGSVAASVDDAGAIVFWRTGGGLDVIGRGRHANHDVRCLAFSPAGDLVASAAVDDPALVLWDPRTGQEVRRFPYALARQVNLAHGAVQLAFSSDGKGVVAAEPYTGNVRWYDAATGAERAASILHSGSLRALVPLSEASRVLSAGVDGRLVVAATDAAARRLVPDVTFVGPVVPVARAWHVPSADAGGEGVAVALAEDGTLTAWPIRTPARDGGLLAPLAVSPDGRLVAGYGVEPSTARAGDAGTVAGRFKREETSTWTVKVRDARSGRTLRALPVPVHSNAVAFSPDARTLYVGMDDGTLTAWDLPSGRARWSRAAYEGGLWSISASDDGLVVATGGGRGVVRLWTAANGTLLDEVGGLADARSVVVTSETSLPTPTAEKSSGGLAPATASDAVPRPAATRPAGSPDPSRYRIFAGSGELQRFFDWTPGSPPKPLRPTANRQVRGMAISPDGRTLAVTGPGKTVDLFDTATMKVRRSLGPFPSISYGAVFASGFPGTSPLLVQTGTDVRVWDADSGADLLRLPGEGPFSLHAMAAPRDGSFVYANWLRRIDFALPRLHRELWGSGDPTAGRPARGDGAGQGPSAVRLAEWYAAWDQWPWVVRLLDAEHRAGRDVPPLLYATALGSVDRLEDARGMFARAAAAGQASDAYGQLWLTAVPLPPQPTREARADGQGVAPPAPVAEPPPELPAGVVWAGDVERLRKTAGESVVVEGVVFTAEWSRSGKVMNVSFAGATADQPGLLVVIFQAARGPMDAAFGGDAAAAFGGKVLRVRGVMGEYGGYEKRLAGHPQIIVSDPASVEIVGSTATTKPQTKAADQRTRTPRSPRPT